MTLVVDASVVAKWFVEEPLSDAAVALSESQDLIAPDIMMVEVANAFRKKIQAGEMDLDVGLVDLDNLRKGIPELDRSSRYMDDALELADELNHPVYDCVYLALAFHAGVKVVTADGRFHDRIQRSRYAGHTMFLGAMT